MRRGCFLSCNNSWVLTPEGLQNFLDLFQNVYSHLTATEFMQCNGPIQVSMINEERHAKSKDGIPIMSFTAFHGR